MAAEQHGRSASDLLEEHRLHRLDGDRIEAGERLVEDQQIRVVHERDGELHALLVPARQGLHLVVRPVAEPQPVEPTVGGRAASAAERPASRAK